MSHFWHIKMKLFSLCYFPSSVPAAWKLILVYFWLIFLIQPEFPHSLPPGLSAGSYSSSPFLLPHLSPRGLWASALPLLETPRTFHDWGMSNSTTAFISRVGFYHQPRRKRGSLQPSGREDRRRFLGGLGKGVRRMPPSWLCCLRRVPLRVHPYPTLGPTRGPCCPVICPLPRTRKDDPEKTESYSPMDPCELKIEWQQKVSFSFTAS